MSKTVVLAEKPSVGRDIARVLGCQNKKNGYIEGNRYIVTWALGHLVTLATPDAYDKKYATWRLEDLPMLPNHLKTVVIKQTGRQFNVVKSQLTRSDVKEVVIATDAGREGELVARWVIDKLNVRKSLKRLWISSVTDKAIRDGFNKLKPGKNYDNLYASAVARSEADWYVGLNATRALTTKYNAQLSSGRVQTPTLGIVAAREEEINNFKPREFYGVELKTSNGLTFTWKNAKNNERLFNKTHAKQLVGKIKNKEATVIDINKRVRKQFAPQLYDLTDLQQDANRLFRYSGKRTLNIMQNLYERHKVLTYPRTDSRVITTDIVPTLKDRLNACQVDEYAAIVKKINLDNLRLPKSVVNNQAVTDHHAIIPTEEPVILEDLTADERKIYDLVVKRFLVVLLDAHEYEETTITIEVENERFTTNGTIVKQVGWKAVYGEKRNKNQHNSLTNIKKGNKMSSFLVRLTEGQTTPPPRLTEGALLKAMENPTRYMDDAKKEHVKTIHQAGGLGTVATRADIIDKLIDGQYMEMRGNAIHLTRKGKQLLNLAPEELRSPHLTAKWEEKLKQIENGKLNKNKFISDIKQYTKKIVTDIKNADDTFKHDNITGTRCPKCDKLMLEISNRHGKMLRCQDRSCNHRRNIYKNTNARCPDCRKRMKLYGEGEGQTFRCTCGHSERLATFEKRRKSERRGRVSRKDVNRYLKNQDDEFTNNALAEALKKFQDKK